MTSSLSIVPARWVSAAGGSDPPFPPAFIANATSGKSKFLSLAYQDVSVRVVGAAAIVRFHWVGESQAVADGKKSATNLHILMNWLKQGADWKLLSRASTKL